MFFREHDAGPFIHFLIFCKVAKGFPIRETSRMCKLHTNAIFLFSKCKVFYFLTIGSQFPVFGVMTAVCERVRSVRREQWALWPGNRNKLQSFHSARSMTARLQQNGHFAAKVTKLQFIKSFSTLLVPYRWEPTVQTNEAKVEVL